MMGGRDRKGRKLGTQNEVLRAIRNVPIRMDVGLGKCEINADQLSKLKLGDVLRLEKRLDAKAEVFIEGKRTFEAALGTRRGKLAVKLLGRYSEDKEEGCVVFDKET